MLVFGPACGFILGSFCTKIYVDAVFIDTSKENWVWFQVKYAKFLSAGQELTGRKLSVIPSLVPLACMSVTCRRVLRLGFQRFQLCPNNLIVVKIRSLLCFLL